MKGEEVAADRSTMSPKELARESMSSNENDEKTDRINPIEEPFADDGNPLNDSNDFDDMESLLPNGGAESVNSSAPIKSKINSLDIDDGDGESNGVEDNSILLQENCCCGLVKSTRAVGNMRILFPDYLYTSGWGVIGPHTYGPVVVCGSCWRRPTVF